MMIDRTLNLTNYC